MKKILIFILAITCALCFSVGCKKTEEHKYGDWQVRKAASCTEDGLEFRTCADCGEEETRTINKSHNYGEWQVRDVVTCIEDGLDFRTCADCDQEETKVVGKLGHSYQNGICGNCGDVNDSSYVENKDYVVKTINDAIANLHNVKLIDQDQLDEVMGQISFEEIFKEITSVNKKYSADLSAQEGVIKDNKLEYSQSNKLGSLALELANNEIYLSRSGQYDDFGVVIAGGEDGIFGAQKIDENLYRKPMFIPYSIDFEQLLNLVMGGTGDVSDSAFGNGSFVDTILPELMKFMAGEENEISEMIKGVTDQLPKLTKSDVIYDSETKYHTITNTYFADVIKKCVDIFVTDEEQKSNIKMVAAGLIDSLGLKVSFKLVDGKIVETLVEINPNEEFFEFLSTNLGVEGLSKINVKAIIATQQTSLTLDIVGTQGEEIFAQTISQTISTQTTIETEVSLKIPAMVSHEAKEYLIATLDSNAVLSENGNASFTLDVFFGAEEESKNVPSNKVDVSVALSKVGTAISGNYDIFVNIPDDVKMDVDSSFLLSEEQFKYEVNIAEVTTEQTDYEDNDIGLKPSKVTGKVLFNVNFVTGEFSGNLEINNLDNVIDIYNGEVWYRSNSIKVEKFAGNYKELFGAKDKKVVELDVAVTNLNSLVDLKNGKVLDYDGTERMVGTIKVSGVNSADNQTVITVEVKTEIDGELDGASIYTVELKEQDSTSKGYISKDLLAIYKENQQEYLFGMNADDSEWEIFEALSDYAYEYFENNPEEEPNEAGELKYFYIDLGDNKYYVMKVEMDEYEISTFGTYAVLVDETPLKNLGAIQAK